MLCLVVQIESCSRAEALDTTLSPDRVPAAGSWFRPAGLTYTQIWGSKGQWDGRACHIRTMDWCIREQRQCCKFVVKCPCSFQCLCHLSSPFSSVHVGVYEMYGCFMYLLFTKQMIWSTIPHESWNCFNIKLHNVGVGNYLLTENVRTTQSQVSNLLKTHSFYNDSSPVLFEDGYT